MTNNVNNLLNRTLAGQLAQKLGQSDSNAKDDKIEASIWNAFVADKGGKIVKEFITLKDAMNSITTYVVRKAAELGKSADELCKQWINNITTPTSEEPEHVDNPEIAPKGAVSGDNPTPSADGGEGVVSQGDASEGVTSDDIPPHEEEEVQPEAESSPQESTPPAKTKEEVKSDLKTKQHAKFKTRMINGREQEYAIYKNDQGETVRQIINDDGTLENLVIIADKGKKQFVTEAKLREACGITKLPEGVKCTVDKQGNLTFTDKYGKTLNAREVATYQKPDKKNKESSGVNDAFREKMRTMETGVSNLTYTIEDGEIKLSGHYSIDSGDFERLYVPPFVPSRGKDGLFHSKGFSHSNFNILNTQIRNKVSTLAVHTKIYQELSKKPQDTLTEPEKQFMQKHEQDLYNFMHAE